MAQSPITRARPARRQTWRARSRRRARGAARRGRAREGALMFITRATRHDRSDLEKLLMDHEWDVELLDKGVAFIARDGAIVGTVRLIEVAPQVVVVEDVLVHKDRRNQGIGRQLIQAAM